MLGVSFDIPRLSSPAENLHSVVYIQHCCLLRADRRTPPPLFPFSRRFVSKFGDLQVPWGVLRAVLPLEDWTAPGRPTPTDRDTVSVCVPRLCAVPV